MSAKWRPLHGVLLFDKPLELSSNAAMQKVRRLFQAEKAGHTGTLDPLATGLLPVCFGEATKFATGMLEADKTYLATLKLGEVTATGDAESEVVSRLEVNFSEADLQRVLDSMRGEIWQLPPMHSALKFQGKPLYEYIRKGETVERQARLVHIYELERVGRQDCELQIRVRCSKGTYVRTLAADIGEKLGCGAHLCGLRRTATGPFRLTEAYSLQQLEGMTAAQRDACLLPVDCTLTHLPRLELDEGQIIRLAKGQRLGLDHGLPDGQVRLYAAGGFAGLGELSGRRLAPRRLVSSIAQQAAKQAQG